MPIKSGEKTPGADSTYQKMTAKKKSGDSPQCDGEDVYKAEGWEDEPDMESPESREQKDRFEKQKAYQAMLQAENKKKKLGIGKWGRKK